MRAEGAKLALVGLKRAEDRRGAYPPLLRAARRPRTLHLAFHPSMQRAEKTNLLEGPVDVVGSGRVRFEVRLFEVVTLRVEFG